MARIEQKYSRIRIHVENRTILFENQNTKNATCAARLEIQNGGIGKHQCKPRCSRISTSLDDSLSQLDNIQRLEHTTIERNQRRIEENLRILNIFISFLSEQVNS